MKIRDKKLLVLRRLGLETNPIGLKDLLGLLNGGFKERTVRRWLDQLVQEELVERVGSKRGTKYRISCKKQSALSGATTSCFGSHSLPSIEYVHKPLYERIPIAYHDEWFDAYIPNTSFYLSEELRNQLYVAGSRTTNKDPAGTYAHQIL